MLYHLGRAVGGVGEEHEASFASSSNSERGDVLVACLTLVGLVIGRDRVIVGFIIGTKAVIVSIPVEPSALPNCR